jgi:hypothetical protein
MTDVSPDLLAALQRLGVTIPETKPIAVRSYDERLTHWHIISGAFECMVDMRDAKTSQEALFFSLEQTNLQPWYVRKEVVVETPSVLSVSRGQWIEWIRSRE